MFLTTFDALIAKQTWTGVEPGVWRRGCVEVKYRIVSLGTEQGAGFLATAPGISAWAATADAAVEKLARRARKALEAIASG
jgi:hypothetical protein